MSGWRWWRCRSLLEHDLLHHCRLLSVSLIPADNKGLDWTTFIYADPHAKGHDVALNEPLWNAHVGALLQVLATTGTTKEGGGRESWWCLMVIGVLGWLVCGRQALEGEAVGEGGHSLLHVSLLHLLRPYVRSSLRGPDDDDEEEAEADGKPSASQGQRAWSLVEEVMEAAGAQEWEAGERAELKQDLRAVERRIPPRLHAILWRAIVAGGGGGSSLRELCGGSEEAWSGLLEALGGSEEDDWLHHAAPDDSDEEGRARAVDGLWTERRRLARHLLAWVLLLEHVEGVALSGRLRDAYSAYVGAMTAVPLVMQVSRRSCGLAFRGRGMVKGGREGGDCLTGLTDGLAPLLRSLPLPCASLPLQRRASACFGVRASLYRSCATCGGWSLAGRCGTCGSCACTWSSAPSRPSPHSCASGGPRAATGHSQPPSPGQSQAGRGP